MRILCTVLVCILGAFINCLTPADWKYILGFIVGNIALTILLFNK